MKDLYTFDLTRGQALKTYDQVRDAYASFFDLFKIPYLVAEADSGSMGGNLSHEYHFPASNGEDTIISCSSCRYVANAELAQSGETFSETQVTDTVRFREWMWSHDTLPGTSAESSQDLPADPVDTAGMMNVATWTGVTQDRRTLVIAYYPANSDVEESTAARSVSKNDINLYAVKAVVDQVAAGIEDPVEVWMQTLATAENNGSGTGHDHPRIIRLFDGRLKEGPHKTSAGVSFLQSRVSKRSDTPSFDQFRVRDIFADTITGQPLNLLQIKSADPCPKCSTGVLEVQRAVELGHTFFLGTRYSKPLQVSVAVDTRVKAKNGPMGLGTEALPAEGHDIEMAAEEKDHALLQMGCHGIGVSRLIAAVANSLADSKGLNWPRLIAPFEVVIIPSKGLEDAATSVYDQLLESRPATRSLPGLDSTGSENSAVDVVLDDREKDMVWKLGDADLIGYPVIVVVGRSWRNDQKCEVQCRRVGLRTQVTLDEIAEFVASLLKQL